jgi:plastocyanin
LLDPDWGHPLSVRWSAVLAIAAIALAACGGDGGDETCSPSGTRLQVTARDVSFDEDCLAAPAGQPFTIELDNQDQGVQHNVSIVDGDEVLFEGEIFPGVERRTYEVEALEEGTYEFRCDVHPDMNGAFVVA